MIVFNSIEKLKNHLNGLRNQQKTIGFVPTMGALHNGHISLVANAKKRCDVVLCSIFVNPTQFNELSDLDKYPRTLNADILLLESAACDILFAPEISEMYSSKELELKRLKQEDKSWANGKTVDFGQLDKVMEGAQRPGHFNGVAQVVSKLFRIVEPTVAFFGQKDFQQLSIIRSMTKQLELPVEVSSCPIVREADGLAMSSRNVLLTPDERTASSAISKTLFLIKELQHKKSIAELKQLATDEIGKQQLMSLEYFEIVDSESLQPLANYSASLSAVACIAVKFSVVRLIDNVILY